MLIHISFMSTDQNIIVYTLYNRKGQTAQAVPGSWLKMQTISSPRSKEPEASFNQSTKGFAAMRKSGNQGTLGGNLAKSNRPLSGACYK